MFAVEVPSKIILFGEHAVVYDQMAIAASINLNTKVSLQCTQKKLIKLTFTHSSSVFTFEEEFIKDILANHKTDGSPEDFLAVSSFRNQVKQCNPTDAIEKCLITFLYLYVNILDNFVGMDIVITTSSNSESGSGIGGSAAYAAGISAVLLASKGEIDSICSESDKSKINHWAFLGEKIFHGKPSGIDNSTVVYGGVLGFKAGSIIEISSPVMNVLLIDSNKPKNTKQMVENVKNLVSQEANILSSIFNAMGYIAESAIDLLKTGMHVEENWKCLQTLVDINQGLLSAIGVSTCEIEQICRLGKKYGFSVKLTGAGGGGFCYCFVPPNSELSKTEFSSELSVIGYNCLEAVLGGQGIHLYKV